MDIFIKESEGNPSSAHYFSNIGAGICMLFSALMIQKQCLSIPVMLDNLLIISRANVAITEVVIRFVAKLLLINCYFQYDRS